MRPDKEEDIGYGFEYSPNLLGYDSPDRYKEPTACKIFKVTLRMVPESFVSEGTGVNNQRPLPMPRAPTTWRFLEKDKANSFACEKINTLANARQGTRKSNFAMVDGCITFEGQG